MNSVLYWDFNIIIFLFTVQNCGPRIRQTVHIGGSWVPSLQIFMLRCTTVTCVVGD